VLAQFILAQPSREVALGVFVLTAVGDVGQVKKTKVEAAAPATSNSTAKPAAAAAKPVRCPCTALRNSQTAKKIRAHLTLPIAHVYLFLYEAGGEEEGEGEGGVLMEQEKTGSEGFHVLKPQEPGTDPCPAAVWRCCPDLLLFQALCLLTAEACQ
jgi:hypothetical protein